MFLKASVSCRLTSWKIGLSVLILSLAFPFGGWAKDPNNPENSKKFLEIPLSSDQIPQILRFPLHEQQSIRYFSAGLGKEERSLSYPPYSLKLIFVQEGGAYMARIGVDIVSEFILLASIPPEHVQGPWLFINLPKGSYIVNATDSSGRKLTKTIRVSNNQTTVSYFRWP